MTPGVPAAGYFGDGSAGVWYFTAGTSGSFAYFTSMEKVDAISNAGQVVGETGTNAYIWSSGTMACPKIVSGSEQSLRDLIPQPFNNTLLSISPIDISNPGGNGGDVHILFSGVFKSGTAQPTGIFDLILTSGSNPIYSGTSQTILRQIAVPDAYTIPINQGNGLINSSGIMAALGTSTLRSGSDAFLLLPVEFTGTDSNPNVDNGTYPGFPSGFDGYTQPNWLSVPENASNSAKAYTPASSTTTIAFTGTTQDPYMWITASPSSTTSSPQTVTANVGYMSGVFSSQIAVGMGAQVATGGRLNLDVKQYQLKTVAMSVIAQQSGTNPIIYPANPPTAATLQAYLNQVYGPQTNTYFTVVLVQYNYATNFDPTNTGTVVIDSTPGSPGGPETTAIRKVARNASFDFNIYYVPSLQGPGSSTGWSFPNLYHDTFVGCNSGAYTKLISAHEIGHLFGLHHPQDPGPQNDPTAPSYDLMQHFVSGEFLDHLQWDIVNPYTPNRL